MKKILFVASHFYPNGSIVESKNNYLSVLELERYGFIVNVAAPVAREKYPANVKYFLDNKCRACFKMRLTHFIRKVLKIPIMPIRFDDVTSIIAGLQNVDFNDYDYIYTVFGNGSEHLAGLKLKLKYPHLKWIAEFRDPWAQNEISKKYLFDTSFLWYANYQWNKLIKVEARVLEKVDFLLVESSYHANQIKADFSYAKDIYTCNGYSDGLLADVPALDIEFPCKPVIGFIGSTYYGYDDTAETFISVLEELESEGLEFTFVSIGDNAFSRLISTSSGKNLHALHKVPYLKSQAYISKLTCGLAITMKNYPNHVNSKIFEYMQFNKPTLAIAPKGGAMDTLLTSTNTGWIVPYKREEMKNKLRNIFEKMSQVDTTLSFHQVKKFDRKNVFNKIVLAIRGLE